MEILLAEGHVVRAWKTDAFHEVLGVNTVDQLADAEAMIVPA